MFFSAFRFVLLLRVINHTIRANQYPGFSIVKLASFTYAGHSQEKKLNNKINNNKMVRYKNKNLFGFKMNSSIRDLIL